MMASIFPSVKRAFFDCWSHRQTKKPKALHQNNNNLSFLNFGSSSSSTTSGSIIDECSCSCCKEKCCCELLEYNLIVSIAINKLTKKMGFEVEVMAGNSQRYYDICGDSLKTLERVFISHCHAKSLAVTVNSFGSKSKQCYPVNLSSFRCLKRLEYMDIQMNNVATFTCDSPFPFQLKHLSLTRCQMTHYDFCILLNCVADTLVSLELLQTSLMDVQCSENVLMILNELHRLSNLKSLKLDLSWNELQKDHFIYDRLDSLTLSKISFEDLFSSSLRKLTCTVMAKILTIDGKDYQMFDLEALQGIFHSFAAKSYPSMKFGNNQRKKSFKTTSKNNEIDAKTGFRFVLGWPKIEPGDSFEDVNNRLKEVFAFESLKVFIPYKAKKSLDSPISLSPALSPVSNSSAEEEETTETFVSAFESLTEISAAS